MPRVPPVTNATRAIGSSLFVPSTVSVIALSAKLQRAEIDSIIKIILLLTRIRRYPVYGRAIRYSGRNNVVSTSPPAKPARGVPGSPRLPDTASADDHR